MFNIHAGVTARDIVQWMGRLEKEVITEEQKEVREEEQMIQGEGVGNWWVFFDEFNTTNALGVLKEIICDRKCLGRPVNEKLVFVAACNPFRLKQQNIINEIGAGLKKDKFLGKNVKYNLTYTVHPIP